MTATSPGVLPAIPGYRLRDQIGRGGFGVVYLGESADGAPVAVKVLHRVLDEDARQRFDAEIQFMGTLGWHPNIVRILDAGAVEGQPFIVMEHLPDGSLGAELRSEGAVPWAIVLRHAVDAATALQVAHNAGLLHRDIKPDNLLRTPDGRVKLSDFGVTVAAGTTDGQRGATGTLAYSAPELLAGDAPSPASDIYAVGATMFALLSGDPAFHRATDQSPAAMILRAYRDPLPDLRPSGIPDPIVRVVERAMAKEPSGRPASAADLVKELQGAAAAESVALPDPAPTGQPIAAGAVRPPSAGPSPTGPAARPSAASRRRAQRWQRVTTAVGGVAALIIAVSVVTVSDFGSQDVGEGAAPPADTAPADADPDTPDVDAAPPPPDADDLADEAPAVPPPAQDSVAPAPAPAPPPPPAPTPLPMPALPATPGTSALPPLTLDAPATGGAGDGDRSVVATATSIEAYDAAGRRTATAGAEGVTALAILGDQLAAVAGDGVALLDADTLELQASLSVPGVVEIVGAGSHFWAATDTGLVRITTDGEAAAMRGAPASLTHIDASGDVVWTATDDGELTVVDTAIGRSSTPATIPGKVGALSVLPDGSALVVVDGVLRRVTTAGGVQDLDVGGPVLDVASTDGGTTFVLTADGVVSVDAAGTTPVPTGAVRDLWASGPVVFAVSDTPPTVERLG